MRSLILPLPTASGAALLGAILLCGTVRGAEPAATPEGRAHFEAGVSYLDQHRYAEAYRELKESYAITPRWVVLGNLSIAAEKLERDGEAIDLLQQYLERGASAISESKAAKHRRTIERLESGAAAVTIEAPGTFWVIDTRVDGEAPIVTEYGPFENEAKLRVRAGEHEIRLERATIAAPTWTVRLKPRDVARHRFEVEPEPPPAEQLVAEPATDLVDAGRDTGEPSHTASYVLWGTGAAASIATAVFLLESRSLQIEANDEFAEACPFGATPDGPCSQTSDADRKAANWRTAGLITGIGALGAIATGTILYFIDSGDPADGGALQEASVRPWVSPTGIGVSGEF